MSVDLERGRDRPLLVSESRALTTLGWTELLG
jgi:hypothetical protein